MSGEKWRDSKYVYVISSLHASLFQLKEFTANFHFVINEMGKLVSAMHPSCMSLYPKINKIDLSFQTNILSLLLKTVIYVKSKDIAFEKIRTSTDKRVWLPPKTSIKKGAENQESSTHALKELIQTGYQITLFHHSRNMTIAIYNMFWKLLIMKPWQTVIIQGILIRTSKA